MAASSQGDDEDEERLALARELAAELAALSAQDVGFGDSFDDQEDDSAGWATSNGEIHMDYVRLDLDMVLQQVTQVPLNRLQPLATTDTSSNDEGQRVAPTSWELLLQSVERNDREFFQPCQGILHEVRTSILDVTSSTSPVKQHVQQEIHEVEVPPHQLDIKVDLDCEASKIEQIACVDENARVYDKVADCNEELSNTEDEKVAITSSLVIVNSFTQFAVSEPPPIVDTTSVDRIPPPLEVGDLSTLTSPLPDVHPMDEKQLLRDKTAEKELRAIAKQQEARELRRLKAHARYEKERDDAAQLLLRLQEEFEAQERNAEATRREAQEQSLMTEEEEHSRSVVAAEREFQETLLMILADENSKKFAAELARIQNAIKSEIVQMTLEDQAERHRMKVERQANYQTQKNLVRSRLGAVLEELTNHHEIRRQIRDQQTLREHEECVQMRGEEIWMRRVVAECRALLEQRECDRNRALMIREDELAWICENIERNQKLQAEERQREEHYRCYMEEEERRARAAWDYIEHLQLVQRQKEERFRFVMEQEEERCQRAWVYLRQRAEAEAKERDMQHEMQRLQVLSNISTAFQRLERVFRQHALVKCLEQWKNWCAQCVEKDRLRSETVDDAAKRIQMWHRRRLQQVVVVGSPLVLEEFSDDEEQPQEEEDDDVDELFVSSPANQEAALRLQSTFRGFHVRRKFANALALAQAVGKHEDGDPYDAVDLDDLIQLPPELVDGWEDPVLPPAAAHLQRQYPQRIDLEEERVDNNDAEDVEDDRSVEICKPIANVRAPSTPKPKSPVKEQSLAATLWNKMKRAKQRQQHTKEERQRQQDPTYRVQKLLNRKPTQNGNSNNNQNSHSRSQISQGIQKAANMVSWSSTGNTKKKPKVKLPSLVERLRRQTMAER